MLCASLDPFFKVAAGLMIAMALGFVGQMDGFCRAGGRMVARGEYQDCAFGEEWVGDGFYDGWDGEG